MARPSTRSTTAGREAPKLLPARGFRKGHGVRHAGVQRDRPSLNRSLIVAGLIGVTIGLGALTWATFGLLLLCGLLAAIPLHRKQPVCPHHLQSSHCRVLDDGFHDWNLPR